MANIVISSGYFDPIHPGHLEYLKACREIGDLHIVILNSDTQAILKKGYSFLDENARKLILEELNCVDQVIISIDTDSSVASTIEYIVSDPTPDATYIFANGGDRNLLSNSSQEVVICNKYNVRMLYGVGSSDKTYSSSNLIKKASLMLKES